MKLYTHFYNSLYSLALSQPFKFIYYIINKLPKPLSVICQYCYKKFPSIIPSNLDVGVQGDGCACTIYKEDNKHYLKGNYGSILYDCDKYELNKCEGYKAPILDPLCDECATKMIKDYQGVKLEGNYP